MDLSGKVLSAKRLGKSVSHIPRRLLIGLSTDDTVTAVLEQARSLRNSSDSYVKKNVFFNRDLTKEKDRAAFEKRQLRRNLRMGSTSTAHQSSLNTNVSPSLSSHGRIFRRSINRSGQAARAPDLHSGSDVTLAVPEMNDVDFPSIVTKSLTSESTGKLSSGNQA